MIEKYLIKNDLTLKRWRRFKRRRASAVAVCLLIFMTVMSFIAPLLANSKPLYLSYQNKTYFPIFVDYAPKEFGITDILYVDYRELDYTENDTVIWPIIKWDPYESNKNVESYPAPPSSKNLLGTDDRGRDVLTRIIYGFKPSIIYAFSVWIITTVLGIIAGGIMGYFGGKVDLVGQRVVEVLSTVPQFFLLIILISIFTPSLLMLICVSCLFSWIGISYFVRGEFLKNRKREFVEAAKSMGASTPSIIFKHILPNSLNPVITFAPFAIAMNILGLASLDFLGFGLEVPTPSWGELISQAQKYYTIAWWLAVYPFIALFTTLTLLNLIGDGVRDAMDPNMV
ncbi:MAG: ABC transporter permease subunit [Bacteriovoracaceae bacterium]